MQLAAREQEAQRREHVSGRAFVTGGAGFAGRHLLDLLPGATAPSREELELLDGDAVRAAVRENAPDTVWHLAALASVGRSWEAPAETIAENVAMTANLLEAVRAEAPEAAVVLISSGEIYGPPDRLPVDEDAPLRPQNPYAVSKAAVDLLGGQYADSTGLRVLRLRPFNHTGPGQSDDYVVGTLTRQVAEAEAAGRSEAVVRTGNPDSARDFSDVRDVARAYVAAAELDAGVYNVASGKAVTVRELIELVRAAARIPVRHEVDPARVRAHDVPEVRGSAERLRAATGWTPEIPLERTVADTLEAWREELGATR
ncbi:MAG: GDP-4-dehydro-6-deoxy-D-mannose reductase [Thermoleophilaceae bacterium]|nr:GDP-4-dehydro-6-deoxy-D-mannose reductase [Thermoleophilaceae bacterium]